MKHWSVDIQALKSDPQQLAIWNLENSVNFGLRGSKIKRSELKKYWDRLDLDPHKKKFLAFLLAK